MIGLHVDIAALLAWRPQIPVMRESTAKSGEGRHHRRERYQAKRGRQSERRKSLSPRDHEILLKLSPTSINQLSRLGLIYISVDGASGRPNDYSVALTCLAKGCFGAVAQCKHVCRWMSRHDDVVEVELKRARRRDRRRMADVSATVQ